MVIVAMLTNIIAASFSTQLKECFFRKKLTAIKSIKGIDAATKTIPENPDIIPAVTSNDTLITAVIPWLAESPLESPTAIKIGFVT